MVLELLAVEGASALIGALAKKGDSGDSSGAGLLGGIGNIVSGLFGKNNNENNKKVSEDDETNQRTAVAIQMSAVAAKTVLERGGTLQEAQSVATNEAVNSGIDPKEAAKVGSQVAELVNQELQSQGGRMLAVA